MAQFGIYEQEAFLKLLPLIQLASCLPPRALPAHLLQN